MNFRIIFVVLIFIIPQIYCDLTFIRKNLAKLTLKVNKIKNVTKVLEKKATVTSDATIVTTCTCVDMQLCHNLQITFPEFDYRSTLNPKCLKTQVCCNSIIKKKSKDPSTTVTELYNKCGIYNSSLPRLNGKDTQIGEFPWMVSVLVEGESDYLYVSGGSIIHPKVVLAAAHTFYDKIARKYIKNLAVHVGSNTPTGLMGYEMEVAELIVHEDFEYATAENDIALLILKWDLYMGPNVQTICLPSPDMNFSGNICLVTGYGKRQHSSDAYYSNELKKVNLPLWASDKCENSLRKTTEFPELFQFHESWLCAGGIRSNDTCTGDGGSPLICNYNDRYYQVGIVSFGFECYDTSPGVYSNIPNLIFWIKEKFTLLDFDTKWFTRH